MTDPARTRWGILATGRIAHSFARNLREVPGAEIVAVGSRSQESADAFVREHGDPSSTRAHASYDALVGDPDVDVVYIGTPHALHLENALAAIAAGKHVLCEKPLTLNAAEAEQMVEAAQRADRFLMEAMWMACHPVIRVVKEGVDARPVRDAATGARRPRVRRRSSPPHRLFDPALGGGALLDMGVYPLTFAHLVLGPGGPDGRHGEPQRPGRRPRRGAGRHPRRGGLRPDGVDDVGLAVHRDRGDRPRPPRAARRVPLPAVRHLASRRAASPSGSTGSSH